MRRIVFVVEPEPVICNAVRGVLGRHNFDVECAYRGEDALQRAAEIGPDVFLIDTLPLRSHGVEIAARLRELGFAHTPMIAVSSSSVMLQVAALYDLFQAYLQKPLDSEELLLLIEDLTAPCNPAV